MAIFTDFGVGLEF